MPPQTPVGLIGIGLMGEVYAQRLIAAGFGVIGFDIDAVRMKRLVQLGGRAASAAEIGDCGVLDRSGGRCRRTHAGAGRTR
jgi:3-hydroxyisobutyrate dehydrogenase-like beta-hydroxyacid dehydrogenase